LTGYLVGIPADLQRFKVGEPPLAGAASDPTVSRDNAADLARVSFELGVYVAEALSAHDIVVQTPSVPKTSAIRPDMTEKDGDAAFNALVEATDGPLDDEGLEALRGLKSTSGIKFWSVPGTDAKIRAKIADVKSRRSGKVA
jgi:hypothetical protein